MTNEEMIETLYGVAVRLADHNPDVVDRVINDYDKGIKSETTLDYIALACIVADLRKEVRTKNLKQNGNANIGKAMMTLIKDATKTSTREYLHGAWIVNGKQYATNSYYVFRLNNPIDSLPKIPDNCKPFNVESIFSSSEAVFDSRDNMIDTPSISDLKDFIITEKAKNPFHDRKHDIIKYPINNKFSVNSDYLLNVLIAFPNAEIHVGELMLCLHDEAGDAIIMGVRIS